MDVHTKENSKEEVYVETTMQVNAWVCTHKKTVRLVS